MANATPTEGSALAPDSVEQYGRICTLLIFGLNANGVEEVIDLSELRIKFAVKRSGTATPNTADIYVYNLEEQTALKIKKEFTRVTLQAGYVGNFGVVFQGNIRQVIIGRESATETFINLNCGDGDRAYNFAIVNTTLAAGATADSQVKAASASMAKKGVTDGHLGEFPTQQLPRGKVMYGNARNYLRNVAQTTKKSWSIQNGKITFVPITSYLPGEQVVLTSLTGMIGTPQQTNDGVNVKCLLNPLINVSGRVKLDNSTILQQKLNLEAVAAARGNVSAINNLQPRRLNADGSYMVLVLEHTGDNRGTDWYTSMICLNIDATANPFNSVQTG